MRLRISFAVMCVALCLLGAPAWGATDAPDIYENDNTPADAAQKPALVGGLSQSHTLHVPGDIDWIPLKLQANVTYTIRTEGLAGGVDTVIWLYDGSTLLTWNDNQSAGEKTSTLVFTAPASRTYLLKVHDFTYKGGSGMGYAVRLSTNAQSVSCDPDAFEPDFPVVQLLPGGVQARNFDTINDRDEAFLSTILGVPYTIETRALGANADTLLMIRGDNGDSYEDDDSNGNRASKITFVATATSYRAIVLAADYLLAGCDSNYELAFTRNDGAQVGDVFEVDDSRDAARTPAIGVPGALAPAERHTFHAKGDEDWLKFDAVGGSRYEIETSNLEARARRHAPHCKDGDPGRRARTAQCGRARR